MVKIPARVEAEWNTTLSDVTDCIEDLAVNALITREGHHKQWYIARILEGLGVDLDELREQLKAEGYEWEPGIAP